ncbi:uncharacterized protein N7483_006900 [Penicillium malachiteum]|uniref:uncharacterized protein n=1 Tax=Penicillium malachiteum TaxID=1324776 RepID=UPI002549972D|nr:uncharacterized protein N7483_006900 [Penicillium malachiteum]KAJ5725543.1 hypothetical protein N7483_006900 [Penicillium malachiteum]
MSSTEKLRARFAEALSHENIKSFLDVLECMNVQVDTPDAQGRTMLWHCVRTRDHKKVDFLIRCGAEPDVTDNEGMTPIHVALMQGEFIDELIARMLLGSRPKTSISEILQGGLSLDQLFLYHADISDSVNAIRFLLKLGADVKTLNEDRETPLMRAAHYGELKTMKILEAVNLLLSSEKLNVNCQDRKGRSAFWLSVHLGRDKISERFLNDSRVDVNFRGGSVIPQWQTTPLYIACYRRNIQMVSCILAATNFPRVDPNIQGDMGMSPLRAAAYQGIYELVAMLLKADGIRINAVDEGENDPLWLAIQIHSVSVVQLFLNDCRLDINCQNNRKGDTYLIAAALYGNVPLVNKLLKFKGIELSRRNKEDESAVEIAHKLNHHQIVQMIIQSMADRGADRL